MRALLRPILVAVTLVPLGCTGCPTDPLEEVDDAGGGGDLLRDGGGFIVRDAGGLPDAGESDAGNSDAGNANPDAGNPNGNPDAGPDECGLTDPGDPNKARVLLVGHPYAEEVPEDLHEIESFTLNPDGTISDDGVRLDVGVRVARLAFVPSGKIALALGEDGVLVSVEVKNAQELTVLDTATLPSAGYGDLAVAPDGAQVYVVGSNSVNTGGVSTVDIGCDGLLTVDNDAFLSMRLSNSLALTADGTQGWLLGGQVTAFEPMDPVDIRLLQRTLSGWDEIGSFDIWADYLDTLRMALSPDGATLVIPNGAPFSDDGAQVSVIQITGNQAAELVRLENLEDVREAIFSPDGQTALVTQLGPGRVVALHDDGTGWEVSQTISGIGTAEQMDLVRRGNLAGRVFIPSTDASGGSNIAMIRIKGPGEVEDLGQFELGEGFVDIPQAIAVQP